MLFAVLLSRDEKPSSRAGEMCSHDFQARIQEKSHRVASIYRMQICRTGACDRTLQVTLVLRWLWMSHAWSSEADQAPRTLERERKEEEEEEEGEEEGGGGGEEEMEGRSRGEEEVEQDEEREGMKEDHAVRINTSTAVILQDLYLKYTNVNEAISQKDITKISWLFLYIHD
ncbi:hypothetical protein H920_06899 [Fukomys damarensis]|uniref:Uncharacterized protein n=1 Tax=Fukomys damarensis TaxID=885580 RepID=A0A091DN88_FUKDA|nr:hypothetical protein H920_06899 [Fukomys damarensis]